MFKEIIKCTQYDLMRAKAKVGQMYFVTDSRVLYKDNGNNVEQRLVFNAVILHTESERLNSIKPTIGKFYYVEETNSLWLFDTRWVLKVGDTTNYNTYYAGEHVSPVINIDEQITGANGDKIIDNNGLLGEGSVVVRDINRIVRGLLKADNAYNNLTIKSYLDDGFLFIPNGHLPYNDLSTSLGALHLTVEKKDTNNALNLNLNGSAHYYGTWNNYGNMFLIQEDTNAVIYPDYVPINDYELIKFYITSTKKIDAHTVTSHIIIRPISDSLALAHIISVNDENSNSVVQNDLGELIFTNSGDVVDNQTIECRRKINDTGDCRISQYTFDTYNDTITIKQNKESILLEVEIGETWADDSSNNTITVKRWIKDKVLTSSEIEGDDSYIHRIT